MSAWQRIPAQVGSNMVAKAGLDPPGAFRLSSSAIRNALQQVSQLTQSGQDMLSKLSSLQPPATLWKPRSGTGFRLLVKVGLNPPGFFRLSSSNILLALQLQITQPMQSGHEMLTHVSALPPCVTQCTQRLDTGHTEFNVDLDEHLTSLVLLQDSVGLGNFKINIDYNKQINYMPCEALITLHDWITDKSSNNPAPWLTDPGKCIEEFLDHARPPGYTRCLTLGVSTLICRSITQALQWGGHTTWRHLV